MDDCQLIEQISFCKSVQYRNTEFVAEKCSRERRRQEMGGRLDLAHVEDVADLHEGHLEAAKGRPKTEDPTRLPRNGIQVTTTNVTIIR